ncbi:cytokine receptor-like [Epargyreus clarus]|uniref:cytokine receptor-like n=1 Tax=Epargyreus clarus TaxID=520877 RepID=UPI003C2CCA58
MFCTANGYSSDDIEFTSLGVSLQSEKINETTRRLYILNPEKQLRAYYCRNKKTSKKCVSRVLVDSPPADVTDFSCISKNLDLLNCSWTDPPSYRFNNYTLTFDVRHNIVHPYCTVKSTSIGTRYCTWDSLSLPRYRQQEETYYFLMKTCNAIGCNNQNFTVDHYSIVKPDPPANLKVVNIEPHSVTLKWKISSNMFDLLSCGVEHIIEYQIAGIDNVTHFHRVDSSLLPSKNKREYTFQLSNLPYAYMQYEARIYIKTKKAVKREFWSDFSYVVFYTASERPNRPPETIAGAFEQAVWQGMRTIYVYWKQIEKYEEAGANFTYKVLYIQGDKTFPIVSPNKQKSQGYVVITDISLKALDIYVSSSNTKGSSLTSSHMYIPSKQERVPLSLTSFSKLAHENGTYQLFWDDVENVDNYTLFWCHHTVSHICSGRMDFTVLDARKNNYIIDLPKEYPYQFAISANKGTSSTGMVWTTCDISKDGFVMYRIPASLHYDPPGKTSLRLKFQMGCALQNGIITGYDITYCPIALTSGYCDESVENMHMYISDPKQMDVVIKNLQPFTTYQVSLSVNTVYGKKDIEDGTAVFTTLEDTPTSPVNIVVSNIKSDSLVISWDPPLKSNGIIGKYVIYNYDKKYYVISFRDVSKRRVTLTGLQASTNYSFTVQACNIAIGVCSNASPDGGILVTTKP